jgi:hypothetical protein
VVLANYPSVDTAQSDANANVDVEHVDLEHLDLEIVKTGICCDGAVLAS